MKIGIDIGGTFTDFAVWKSPEDGYTAIATFKRPSTPHDYAEAVIDGLKAIIAEHELSTADAVTVVHGTTVGTNAVIERSQDPLCLIVTKGHRDILEFARLRLEKPMDLFGHRKRPLIPRELVLEVTERVSGAGEVITPLSLDDVRAVARTAEEKGIRNIAVCLLHGHRQPCHEQQVMEVIAREFPGLQAQASHDIWPQPGEYERAVVTLLNLYVKDRVGRYISRIESFLNTALPKARLLITRSNGGSMSAGEACRYPIHTLLSGPAAGVTGAEHLRDDLDLGDVLTMDMGGTSTDLSLIAGKTANSTAQSEIGDFPMFLPVTAIEALGAGGGSVIWADQGALKIGPRSAGAFPGPACYGNGGEDATLTDAFLLCGLLPASGLLGGDLKLDVDKSTAVFEKLAAQIDGADAMALARSALTLANSEMLVKTLPFLARQGVEPQQLTLMVFGGAGGIQGPAFAWELGIQRVIIPRMTSVLCAYGCLVSHLMTDNIRSTQGQTLAEGDVKRTIAELSAEGAAWVRENGGTSDRNEWHADLRYPSQAFPLSVQVSQVDDGEGALRRFHDAFFAEHQRLYGTVQRGFAPVIDQLRVRTISSSNRPRMSAVPNIPAGAEGAVNARRNTRKVTLPQTNIEACPVHAPDTLTVGERLEGPAILENRLSTILVPPGFAARSVPTGDIWIEAAQGSDA